MSQVWSWIGYSLSGQLTYNLSRPYPFGRLFKFCTILGFLILLSFTVLFSIANSAYELRPEHTTNPNATEGIQYWFNAWPFTFGSDKLYPKCQHLIIQPGHSFMTTNFGLRYTVTAINFRVNSTASLEPRPSLPYHNSMLEHCEVNNVHLRMTNYDQSPPPGYWHTWGKSSASVVSQCEIRNEEGTYIMYFETEYVNPMNEHYHYIIKDNAQSSASMWWGARLLNNYFFGVQTLIAQELKGFDQNGLNMTLRSLSVAQFGYLRNNLVDDARSDDLFRVTYYFLQWDGILYNQQTSGTRNIYNNASFALSRPLTEGLFFAKVMRSLVLTDLGDNRTSNMLIHEDLLKYALDPNDDFNRLPGGPLSNFSAYQGWNWRGISPPNKSVKGGDTAVDMSDAYEAFNNQTGGIGSNASAIYAQYLCSVPQSRSVATALLFTLVATMSIMQVAFIVFRWAAGIAVEAKDPSAMYCRGCLAHEGKVSSLKVIGDDDKVPSEHSVELRYWQPREYQAVNGR